MQYYGKLGQIGAEAGLRAWEITPDHIAMQTPPPSADAIAQADGTWLDPDAPDMSIEAVKSRKAAAVQAEKSRVKDGGFFVDVEGMDTHFDSDKSAQSMYAQFQLRLFKNPSLSVQWRASEGIWVTMNEELFARLVDAGEAHMQDCFNWQAERDAEIAAATTVAEVEAVSETCPVA